MSNRKIVQGVLALAFCLPVVLSLFSGGAPLAAPVEKGEVEIALSKDAYWYEPGATVQMLVTLANRTGHTVEDVSVIAKVHSANETRSDLDECFEGEPTRYYRLREVLGRDLELGPGDNSFKFEFSIPSYSLSSGVYPLTLEAVEAGETLSSAISELIIISPSDTAAFEPLRLAVLFDTMDVPHREPGGDFRGDVLARECSSAGEQPGWYVTLIREIEKWNDFRFNINLSPLLLEEMYDMADGCVIAHGDREVKLSPDSARASDVAGVVEGFKRLAADPRVQFTTTPYASPNLEKLASLGWVTDFGGQLEMGHDVLEEGLDKGLSTAFLYPPGLLLDSAAIGMLPPGTGSQTVVSAETLQRTPGGNELLQGLTLGSPVILTGEGDRDTTALVADSRLQEVVGRVGPSGDPHGVAQCLLSELTNLYLERPAALRACVMVWPGWWRPSDRVLDEVARALSSAPWLRSETLDEMLRQVPPLEETSIEVPGSSRQDEDDYFMEVQRAHLRYEDFAGIVAEGNELLARLKQNLYVSESDIWRQRALQPDGLEYAEYVVNTVDEELAKIEMPQPGNITLTSRSAEIPLSVVNNTGYTIEVVLRLTSDGLSFPDGDTQQVTLEPKENLLEIPVETDKSGRVRFNARLESQRTVLAELDVFVLTSRFNTIAVVIVGALLGLICVIWIIKVLARRNVGKHKKKQLEKNEDEDGREGD